MDEPVVYPFRREPLRKKVILAVFLLGAVAWIATSRSFGALVIGGIGIVIFGSMIVLMILGRGSRKELVVSREGVRTSRWTIAWDGIAGAAVERTLVGEVLVIEPAGPDAVDFAPSRGFAVEAWINDRFQGSKLTLPQKAIQEPLAGVLAAMEEKSGRTFGRGTLG